jgi:hypothetical protein
MLKLAWVQCCLSTLGLLLAGAVASAQTDSSIVVTDSPDDPHYSERNVICIDGDAAPGFESGSIASDGSGKTDIYFTPEELFGRAVLLGEVESISYYTKTGESHVVDPRDWALTIYTKPFAGDVSTPTWYGARIGSEPYFAANLNDPPDTWNQWSTDGATNTLRFFESTAGAPGADFGAYDDPFFDDFVMMNSLGTSVPYAAQDVLFFSLQTGSGWADGFTGQLDGLQIVLMDGSVATVNFECEPADEDGDGVPDADDHCPDSDLDGFVQVGSVTTTIDNAAIGVDADGCSVQDLVNECEDHAKNHGQFVSCINQLANDLYKDGTITKQQRDEMKSAAAKSSVGKK